MSLATIGRACGVSLLVYSLSACQLHAPASACESWRLLTTSSQPSPVRLRLDFRAADAMSEALERDVLRDADLSALLAIPGVLAMVDNVTRYIPGLGVREFHEEVREFARTKRAGPHPAFQLADVWRERAKIRTLVESLRAGEATVVGEALSSLERYRPDTGPLTIDVHFTAGGVSDGFLPDDQRQPAIFANLARADGDLDAVVANLAHETYHVLQKSAQRRAGFATAADFTGTLPAPERLLAVTLSEGLANYVVDPTCAPGADAGGRSPSQRRYDRNARPTRIRENFAVFDTVLAALRSGRMTWQEAYDRGFSGNEDTRFYFVGYQMAKAIEQRCGAACIPRLFEQAPAEFFRHYISLYRQHEDAPGRFSAATEAYVFSLR